MLKSRTIQIWITGLSLQFQQIFSTWFLLWLFGSPILYIVHVIVLVCFWLLALFMYFNSVWKSTCSLCLFRFCIKSCILLKVFTHCLIKCNIQGTCDVAVNVFALVVDVPGDTWFFVYSISVIRPCNLTIREVCLFLVFSTCNVLVSM